MNLPESETLFALQTAMLNFNAVNEDPKLSEADEKQLKESYLKTVFVPELQRIIRAKAAAESQPASPRPKPWRMSPLVERELKRKGKL